MHKCAGVHDFMTTFTNLQHTTSEQYIELGSRCRRDVQDLNNTQEWFNDHDPFDINEERLRSLSTGLTASKGDGVNCDKTEEVGKEIQRKLDNITVADASVKRKDTIRSLDHLCPGVHIENQNTHINPNLLFS